MARSKLLVHVQDIGVIDDSVVLLGERHIRKWKIPTDQSLTVRFGSARHFVRVISSRQNEALRISSSLAERLGIRPHTKLSMQYKSGTRTLHLGPLIGVLLSRIDADAEKPFGANTAFCRELAEACRMQGAAVYFFSIYDISANYQTVRGWTYSGRWLHTVSPVPDVIYNRLASRKLENNAKLQQFVKEAKTEHQTAIFNEKFLDKSEVFEALKKDTASLKYLPESHLCRNYQTLKSMCSKYPVVFLKPVTGSLGKGIIRLVRRNDLSYEYHFAGMNGVKKQIFANLGKLFSALSSRLKSRRHQIQQGLNLIQIHGRPVDFRALVQKNERGDWKVTSIVARVAGDNHFVSNVARGGTLTKVADALRLSNLSPAAAKSAFLQLRKAAMELAYGIDEQIPGHFAEWGIDLGVDTQGRTWLLEINSKPSKNDNTPLNEGKIRPSVKQIVRYSLYLCGF